jgi:hypothetical protein
MAEQELVDRVKRLEEKGKKGANIALNAPVMITYPSALVLATAVQDKIVGSPWVAAAVVSFLVYALDWASRQESWKGDVPLRRAVYAVANTLILGLVLTGTITLSKLGLG